MHTYYISVSFHFRVSPCLAR